MTGLVQRWRLYLGVRRHLIRARRVELAHERMMQRRAEFEHAYACDLVRQRSIAQARERSRNQHPSSRADDCSPFGLPRPGAN